MLVAVLNCCTKEELEESESDEEILSPTVPLSPIQEDRKKVIKNKILAVGRLSRVFQVLRSVAATPFLPILILHLGRSPRGFQSSRTLLVQASFLTVLLSSAQRASKTPSPISRTLGSRISRTSVCHQTLSIRKPSTTHPSRPPLSRIRME